MSFRPEERQGLQQTDVGDRRVPHRWSRIPSWLVLLLAAYARRAALKMNLPQSDGIRARPAAASLRSIPEADKRSKLADGRLRHGSSSHRRLRCEAERHP